MIMLRSHYYKTNSVIHELNCFLKLILFFSFFISVFFANNLVSLMFLMFFMLIIILATNIPIKKYFSGFGLTKTLIIFLIIFDLLLFNSFFHLLNSIIKLVLIDLMFTTILFTTRISELILAFNILLSPLKLFKINTYRIALYIMFAIDFKHIFIMYMKKVIKSYNNRFDNKAKFKIKFQLIKNSIANSYNKTLFTFNRLFEMATLRNCDFDINTKSNYNLNAKEADFLLIGLQLLMMVAIIVKR